jgi:tripartite-type tricarboxylate transporter receptor subunit TctC
MTVMRLMLFVLLIMVSGWATAQDRFPNAPIKFLNPLSAGGGVDIAMRALALELQPLLGQPVVVENKPGAGGLIAGHLLARSKPDGYTMGLLQSPQAIPEVYAAMLKPNYSGDELRPVIRFMTLLFALPSRVDAPWKTLPELLSYVKANPNKVRFGQTVGLAHPAYLLQYALLNKNGLQVIGVPYKGAGEATTALLGGHIDVAFPVSVTSIQQHVRAGKLAILAVHSAERSTSLPDTPTFVEQGADPGISPIYNTIYVPRGTPDNVVRVLHDAVKAAMETPAMREHAQKFGYSLTYASEAEIREELKRSRAVYKPLVESLAESLAKEKREQ